MRRVRSGFGPSLARTHPRIGLYLLHSKAHWGPRESALSAAFSALAASGRLDGVSHIIDVGCGPGLLVPEVRRRGLRYVGVDTDGTAIGYCRRSFDDENAQFVHGGVDALPFEVGDCHIVVMNGVLHHLSDAQAAPILSRMRGARALAIVDHLRVAGRTPHVVRLMQALDAGRHVREFPEIFTLVGREPDGVATFSIRVLGVRIWDMFLAQWHAVPALTSREDCAFDR